MRPIRRQLGNAGGVSGRNAGGAAKTASVTAGVGGGAAIAATVAFAVVAGVEFAVLQALLSGAGRGQPAGGEGNNGHGLGLELLRKPSGIEDRDGALFLDPRGAANLVDDCYPSVVTPSIHVH